MSGFKFQPSKWVPFRDVQAIERCRRIPRSEIENHPNPDLKIRVVKDADLSWIWITDMFKRIQSAAAEGRELTMILPNPVPGYRHLARLINACRVDCRRLWAFAMDEYADQDGRIAPADWPQGFTYAMRNYLWNEIDPELRPPLEQFIGFTDANLPDYGRMIEDRGGGDACYTGPGWTGHVAFIEPDAPEFDAPLDEWMKMGPRLVTLSPFTLAQNSLHGSFGYSGDLSAVPPRAATIGPAEVVGAKYRMEVHGITVAGTATSWQRLMTRLCLHGPVTPRLPTSIHQRLRTDCYITETAAADIAVDFDREY